MLTNYIRFICHAPGAPPTPLAALVHVTDNRIMRYYSCVLCHSVCKTWFGHFSLNVILRIYWQHNNSVFSEQLLIVFRYIDLDLDHKNFLLTSTLKTYLICVFIISYLNYTFLYDPKNIPVRNIPTTCKWYLCVLLLSQK